MSKPLNGRLAVLQMIATRGPVSIVYGATGFIKPNQWISSAIIRDFIERGLLEQKENQAEVTKKGHALLVEKKEVNHANHN